MSCRCKDFDIDKLYSEAAKLRVCFIKRLTEDSETADCRRKDFNEAIFDAEEGYACFNGTNLSMILEKFDAAVKDYRRTFCDDEKCRRK